jgi:hypothetical protein
VAAKHEEVGLHLVEHASKVDVEQRGPKMDPRTTAGALIPAALEAGVYDDIEEASD